MGSICMKSMDDDDETYNYGPKHDFGSSGHHGSYRQALGRDNRRMTTVAMLATVAHNAGGMMNQMAHTGEEIMDPLDFQEQVRKAKAETRTVTIRNDCLYIDYEFVGHIPPGMASLAYE